MAVTTITKSSFNLSDRKTMPAIGPKRALAAMVAIGITRPDSAAKGVRPGA